jgi:glycosyltransferase involved in cell wall biosynthesis
VFSVGEDGDCVPALPNCRTARERVLYRYGLRNAHVVVAQTRWQQEALKRHFGRSSVLIRSAAPDPGEPRPFPPGEAPRVLWAGRLAPQKRPELVLELARRCPGVVFDVVGAPPSGAAAREFDAAATAVTNVQLHGFVPHGELGAFYDRAVALVCTSLREGFPNTFLEAWSRGRPVVTTVDPDNVVRQEEVGLVAAGVEDLAEAVRCVAKQGEEWAAKARRARAYYVREHRPDRVLDLYESLLDTLDREGGPCNP